MRVNTMVAYINIPVKAHILTNKMQTRQQCEDLICGVD